MARFFLMFIAILWLELAICLPRIKEMNNIDDYVEENSKEISENDVQRAEMIEEQDVTNNAKSLKCPAGKNCNDDIIEINTHSKNYNIADFTEFDIRKYAKDGNKRNKRSALGLEREWYKKSDGNVYVPYMLDPYLASVVPGNLILAIQDFNQYTCIRFVPHTTEFDYIYIRSNGDGCWSYIGRMGGIQNLSLDYGCQVKGIIIHELMHAIGFFHEQSRTDRDEHINIDFSNIAGNWHRQFDKTTYGQAFIHGEEYDYSSVMHYGNYAAAIDLNQPTITVIKDASIKLGQREGFSKQDLREINLKYRCGREYVHFD